MRPVTVTVTGTGVSSVIPIDQYISPCNIGMAVKIGSGTTFQVQHTFDDVFAPGFDPSTATWFNHPSLAGTADEDGNYASPPRGVRLSVSAGTGVTTLILVQAGGPSG